ncbi:MAG: hypothetical protein RBR62_01925 [Bacteroidales bacterium]|nr:hypothetical protein [Bacteroidales bacterium]HHV41028.1 DUF4834 family protein [Bacteroidales bacterium]
MNILIILFSLLVVYFIMRLAPILLSMRINKMFKKHKNSTNRVHKKPSKEKIIGKQVGEYVDFEEVEDS